MDDFKRKFIADSAASGALRAHGDYGLKSKRSSPWFFNAGDFNDGVSTAKLGRVYADTIQAADIPVNVLYGIPEKGSALVVATAIALAEKDINLPWFFTRKVLKEYGEATNLSPAERRKALVVGRAPKDGDAIATIDDVFTAGDAKYEAKGVLDSMGVFTFPFLAIAVDRMEAGIDGRSAIEEYEEKTNTKVLSAINALEVLEFLRECVPLETPNGIIDMGDVERMENYLRVYGNKNARQAVWKLQERVIGRDRSVVIACDVETREEYEDLVMRTHDIDGVGGFKIGFELGLGLGLKEAVDIGRKYTDKPFIYDHQKAGTDIPDTGKNFARVCKKAGVDTVIFFPQAGPETERAWIYHAFDQGLKVIMGGWMTHPAYAQSEGGFIADEGILDMYRIASRAGINQFVVPGTKPEAISRIKEAIEAEGVTPVFYAPGFVAQGGKIEDATKVAGEYWHAIVGRGIFNAEDKRAAAIEHTSKL